MQASLTAIPQPLLPEDMPEERYQTLRAVADSIHTGCAEAILKDGTSHRCDRGRLHASSDILWGQVALLQMSRDALQLASSYQMVC